jgi:hypothetical protein
MPFQGLPHIFGVQQLTGAIPDNAQFNRKSEIRDGGCQTESAYISVSRLDNNALPTATHKLLGSSNSVALLRILPDITRL